MSIIILNCFCDSTVAKICGMLNVANPMDVEQGTNCVDVLIAAIICAMFYGVARIAKKTILGWKDKEIKENPPVNKNQSNSNPQVNTLKLMENLLDFLKSQTIIYGEKGEFKSYKSIESPECKMYNDVLTCLIEALQEDDKKINIANLKEALHVSEPPK